jgi:hypothetical protein
MNRKPYDIELNGNAAIDRFIHGLLIVGGQLTDSYKLPEYSNYSKRYWIRVQIPEGKEREFELVTRLTLIAPLKVNISAENK